MIGNPAAAEPDVVLVGAGIMSVTLGVFLKELAPALNVEMFETLAGAAFESSDDQLHPFRREGLHFRFRRLRTCRPPSCILPCATADYAPQQTAILFDHL